MTFLLYVARGGYVLKKRGEDWEAKFPNLQAALRYAESLPGSAGAKLVVHNEAGQPRLELKL